MTDSQTFVFYESWEDALDLMPEGDGDEMRRHITKYGTRGIEPENLRYPLNVVMILIKAQIDAAKEKRAKQSDGGKRSGEVRKKQSKKTGTSEVPSEVTSKLLRSNVNGNDNVNVNDNYHLSGDRSAALEGAPPTPEYEQEFPKFNSEEEMLAYQEAHANWM